MPSCIYQSASAPCATGVDIPSFKTLRGSTGLSCTCQLPSACNLGTTLPAQNARAPILLQALEALRKLKNEKAADVKLLTLEKTNLNTLKDNAARLREDVRAGEEALKEKEGHRRHLQEEMKVSGSTGDTLGLFWGVPQGGWRSAEGTCQAQIRVSCDALGRCLCTCAAGTGADKGCW